MEEPWYIKDSKLDIETWRYDIRIDFRKWSKFLFNKKKYGVYRTRARTVKHLFMWQYETYLHIRMPEIKTETWKIVTVDCPIMRPYAKHTYHFEGLVLDLVKYMTVKKVAEHLKIHQNTVMGIVKYYVWISKDQADYKDLKYLWIDETSRKKWHHYISLWVNLETRKVCSISEWKGKEAIRDIRKEIEEHNGNADSIEQISIDLSPAFISWTKEEFRKAIVTYDKFHVTKLMLNTMDKVRKKEAIQNKILRGSKYLRLYNKSNLNEDKQKKLEELMRQNESLTKVYQLKENLKVFYDLPTYEEARDYLTTWCEHALSVNIPVVTNFVKTIKRHREWILNHIRNKITNGVLEWINSVIQLVKRRARWYTNIENLKAMIYLLKWDFEILLPTY